MIAAAGRTAVSQQWLQSIPQFPLASSDLTIRQHVEPLKPFTVAGECGTFVGQQDGSFEAWVFPVKLLSHFHLRGGACGLQRAHRCDRTGGGD